MIPCKEIMVILLSYALGCICIGYYLTRFVKGVDIRSTGSGNLGARNVGRILGKWGFYVTLISDVAKGAAAMILSQWFDVGPWWMVACLLAVLSGHIWPIQLGFHGGKGISVMIGSLLVLDMGLILVLFFIALILYRFTNKYMLSGMCAMGFLPVLAWLMSRPGWEITGMAILSLLIVVSHRDNILSLIRHSGEEKSKLSVSVITQRGSEDV
jgi:glycerol-3-phosphate acyltransferase PlsY